MPSFRTGTHLHRTGFGNRTGPYLLHAIVFTGAASATRSTSPVIARAFIKMLGYNEMGWPFQTKVDQSQFFTVPSTSEAFELRVTFPDLDVDDSFQVLQIGFELTTEFASGVMPTGSITVSDLEAYIEREGGPEVVILSHPVDTPVAQGGEAVFSVGVDGPAETAFRWQASFDGGETFANLADGGFFGATLSGALTDTLTVSAAPLILDGMVFRVRVSAGELVEYSDPATLSVAAESLPVFLASPTFRTVVEQGLAVFTVSVDGFPEPSVRWQVSTDEGATFGDLTEGAPYSGVDTTTLTILPVVLEMDGYRFRVKAENSAGTAHSASALLTVTPLPALPFFTLEPQDQTVSEGSEVLFSAQAGGHPAPAFQWQISVNDGGDYSNITDSSFGGGLVRDTTTADLRILSASSFVDGALFRVRATNSEGVAFSRGARLSTFAILSLGEWLEIAGVPADRRGPTDRHGPLRLSNLEAYAMGLPPLEASADDLPRVERASDGSGVLRFRYQVNTRAVGIVVLMEASTDLATWTPAKPINEIVHLENDGVEMREAVFSADTRFLRLRVGDAEHGGMVLVGGGTLASSNELNGAEVDTFYISRFEVTWGEWKDVRDRAVDLGYDLAGVGDGCADDHPVHTVNWYDVVKWCNAKSELEGLTPMYIVSGGVFRTGEPFHTTISQNLSNNGYRLPSEAEWEFAARGGNQTNDYRYAGSDDLEVVGWYTLNSGGAECDLSSGRGFRPVGQKAANELGLYDMSGNAWEWCWDQWSTSYRQLRGGHWGGIAYLATVFTRASNFPSDRNNITGFRLARSAPPDPEGMVLVEGGTLSTTNELNGTEVDTFYMGIYEVTFGEWQEVRAWAVENDYDTSIFGWGCADDHPVHSVRWYDVVKWCNAKSEKEGLTPVYTVGGAVFRTGLPDHTTIVQDLTANGYRLPLEAEWEFAARGGNKSRGVLFSGSDDLGAVGWFRSNSGGAACDMSTGRGTWPVGQKAANELGLYDMSGNVWEWCWDQVGPFRRIRGGGWPSWAVYCSVSYQSNEGIDHRRNDYGFRLARTPSP